MNIWSTMGRWKTAGAVFGNMVGRTVGTFGEFFGDIVVGLLGHWGSLWGHYEGGLLGPRWSLWGTVVCRGEGLVTLGGKSVGGLLGH